MVIRRPSSTGGRSTTPTSLTASASFLELGPPDLRVRHLPTLEDQGHLDFVLLLQKFLCVLGPVVKIVRTDAGPQADALDLHRVGVLAGFLLLFRLVILELAVIQRANLCFS